MKKIWILLTGLLISAPSFADINLEPLLDKISLQLQAEQWVTTKTALVNVAVNAAVTDQGIEKIQAEVMQKLVQLSDKGEWHILSFDRQLDKSGLEGVQLIAQARLPQTDLGALRGKAKSISKPGETFSIDQVRFTPSDEEIKQANSVLRANLYQQAKAEIEVLNKTYTDQKYYLHQIDFQNVTMPEAMMQPMNYMAKTASLAAPAPALNVGNKVQLQASVVVASMSDLVVKKLNTP